MRLGTLLIGSLTLLVTLLQISKVGASDSLEAILQQCEEKNMTPEGCKTLMVTNGYSANITVVTAQKQGTQNTVEDVFYYQVDLYVDYHGLVLGPQPDFTGVVSYPYVWRGDPERGIGTRRVGPWDCKGLSDVRCCAMIETDVWDQDINGNNLACRMEEAFYIDPVTKDRFGVYVNPVDMSINYLTADDLTALEEREHHIRQDLISLIDATLVNKNCPKATLQSIHATFLHSMRGVPQARAYYKYTKNAIRNMNRASVTVVDATQDPDLQYALPLMKGVIERVDKNGGLHPLGEGGYIVQQVGDSSTVATVKVIGYLRGPLDLTRVVDEAVQCLTENPKDLSACADELEGLTVITVHPRSLDDPFYNQVVVPVDYKGSVLGAQPAYDGRVFYRFEWRGNAADGLGTRYIGPWNCKDLSDVECCDLIQASVPDRDTKGNYIDCWFEESFYKDPFTKKMVKIFYNEASKTVSYPNTEEVESFQAQEAADNAQLVKDIDTALHMTACPKQLLWAIYGKIRHAVRGNASVQKDPQKIREALLSQTGATIDVTQNVFLQTLLPKIVSALSSPLDPKIVTGSSSPLDRSSTSNGNGTIVVVVDENNNIVDVSRRQGSV